MNRNIKRKFESAYNPLVVVLVVVVILANIKLIHSQFSNSNLPPPPTFWEEHWFEHVENVTRVYLDPHVAGYLDQDVDGTVRWPFEYLSKVWRYVKNTYGNFGPDQHVYVILHAQKYKGGHASNYFRTDHDRRNVIDFGQASKDAWTEVNQYGDIISLTSVAGFIVEDASKQTSGSPAFDVSQYNWNAIFVYDVLLNVGMKKEAERFLERELEKRENFPQEGTYWMRDWFLPIYQKYGGADVIDHFLSTLYFSYSRGLINGSDLVEYEYKGDMNMGEFVHFWSGAARENLRDLAVTAFNWTLQFQEEFEEARIKFPALEYKCDDCKEFPNLRPPPVVQESTKGRTTIIAVSVSGLLLIVVILVVILIHSRRKIRKLREQIRELTTEEVNEFFEGSSNKESGQQGNNASIQSLPFNKSYELPRDKLIIAHDQVIGSGQFGLVLRGVLKGIEAGYENSVLPVAVKTVKPDVDVEYFKALLMELKVMAYLGGHENIASLLGACTVNIKNREIYVALELCAHGDLRKYLVENREHFQSAFSELKQIMRNEISGNSDDESGNRSDMTNEETSNKAVLASEAPGSGYSNYTEKLTTSNLLLWSRDIANGMTYLAEKKVIHGDLAARNVLLTISNVAKISDFGLSRQLVNYSTYLKTSTSPLPWRWMAVESLKQMHFSIESDVWAFGITMWEIFGLGELPYPGWIWDYEFVDKLVAGNRLHAPSHANQAIYKVMFDCWKLDPQERPTFAQIHKAIQKILAELITTQC